MNMRALSIRQPWADSIASGRKKIEYRTWSRNVRGDLLVVASASRHDEDCADEGLDPDALTYGAAVCVVDLWKVTGTDGDYSWHLRNPRRVIPFAVKGYASLYHVDDSKIRFAKGAAPKTSAPTPRNPKRAIRRNAPSVVIMARDARECARWRNRRGGTAVAQLSPRSASS